MRRRLTLASTTLAILLALLLPATVAAASYTYTVQKNTCTVSGGDNGYGHFYFKVKLQENGWSDANKFTFAAKAQHKELGGGRWYTSYNWGTFTWTFPDNGDNYWYSRWYTYDPPDFAWHRIKVVLKVWHNGTLLASRTLYSKTC
jgi:hypothetical protein